LKELQIFSEFIEKMSEKGEKMASRRFRKKKLFLAGSFMNEQLVVFQLSEETILLGHFTAFMEGAVFGRGHPIYFRARHIAFGGWRKSPYRVGKGRLSGLVDMAVVCYIWAFEI